MPNRVAVHLPQRARPADTCATVHPVALLACSHGGGLLDDHRRVGILEVMTQPGHDAVAEAEIFVALALERSVYLAKGPDHGLTAEELAGIAVCLGKNKQLILSAADDMRESAHLIRTSDGRFRLLPGDWRFTRFADGFFCPEYRGAPALDVVVKFLRDKGPLMRQQIIAEGNRPLWGGFSSADISMAIEILYLARVVRENEGMARLASDCLHGPLPTEILQSKPTQQRDPFVDAVFGTVDDCIRERQSRSPGAGPSAGTIGAQGSPHPPGAGSAPGGHATRNLLFLDVHGWSKLPTDAIRAYVEIALPEMNKLLAGATFKNTWGDAIVATFASARETADVALSIRHFFERGGNGIAEGMTCRISLHQGEVLVLPNAIRGGDDIFGEAVHLAARLEPVTEPGYIFCTKEFAAALNDARETGHPVPCPLGTRPLAKDYGEIEMFAVRYANEPDPTHELKRKMTNAAAQPTSKTGLSGVSGIARVVTTLCRVKSLSTILKPQIWLDCLPANSSSLDSALAKDRQHAVATS